MRTLQKLGLGERDLALGPVFSVPFVFFVPPVFFLGVAEGSRGTGLRAPGAGVLSLVAGTERFIWDMAHRRALILLQKYKTLALKNAGESLLEFEFSCELVRRP